MKHAILLAALLTFPVLAQEPAAKVEESVKPGINTKFLDPDLKVDEWLKKFEVESREVFDARDAVVAACKMKKGMTVADVGAGTGLYTRLFAGAIGEEGWVYAVDINPRFLEHIQARAKQEGQKNITSVLCPEDSISLPANSLDLIFICDTYHHFEFPKATNESILRSLKPGGELLLVDFERVIGMSSAWLLGHVRAGKKVFRQEIEDAGLEFVEQVEVEGLKDNYFLRFKKP